MTAYNYATALKGLCLRLKDTETQGIGAADKIREAHERLQPLLASGRHTDEPGFRKALALSTLVTEWLKDPTDTLLLGAVVHVAQVTEWDADERIGSLRRAV